MACVGKGRRVEVSRRRLMAFLSVVSARDGVGGVRWRGTVCGSVALASDGVGGVRRQGTALGWCALARDGFGMVCFGEGWLDDMRRRDGFFAMVCVGKGRLWDGVRWRGTAVGWCALARDGLMVCVGGTASFRWCASARDGFGMVCVGKRRLWDGSVASEL